MGRRTPEHVVYEKWSFSFKVEVILRMHSFVVSLPQPLFLQKLLYSLFLIFLFFRRNNIFYVEMCYCNILYVYTILILAFTFLIGFSLFLYCFAIMTIPTGHLSSQLTVFTLSELVGTVMITPTVLLS